LIECRGQAGIGVARSLNPKKAGDRVKTNRRDAEGLARVFRFLHLRSAAAPLGANAATTSNTSKALSSRGFCF